ncbi:MAG: ATP synthase subunit C [Candidatus Njordarchaeia archaeon]
MKWNKKRTIAFMLLSILPILNMTLVATYAISPHPGIATYAEDPYKSLAMALSTGLAAIGAGIAVASSGTAAIASITEKPELFGRAIIIVGLGEGIAIYGLLISFLIWMG